MFDSDSSEGLCFIDENWLCMYNNVKEASMDKIMIDSKSKQLEVAHGHRRLTLLILVCTL